MRDASTGRHIDPADDWDWMCAAVPHQILNVMVVYCGHDLRYVVHAGHTNDQGESLEHYVHALGPFDATEEVVASVAHEVLRWLGVHHERRNQERE